MRQKNGSPQTPFQESHKGFSHMTEKQAFAFFDFDGTMIPGDSIAAFVRYARKKGIMPRREFFKALLAAKRSEWLKG